MGTQRRVAAIGLGAMGSALARAFVAAGHDVVVWNRTAGKADELAKLGASVASSPADAISGSDIVVVCVRGYSAAQELLGSDDAGVALRDKTLVQLGNGTPIEVEHAAAWCAERGTRYLDGSIMTFPEAVGTDECRVLLSGDRAGFEEVSEVLDAIGGDIRYLGEDPAASAIVNSSGLAFLYAASHAFLGAAALCDSAGAPLELLNEVVADLATQMPPLFGEFAEMIGSGTYDSRNLRLASGAENLESIIEFGRAAGVSTELFDAAARSFRSAAEQGLGVNIAATFELLRSKND